MSTDLINTLHSLWYLWVMVIFCGIVLWAYWPRNKGKIEAYAQIPFRDEIEER